MDRLILIWLLCLLDAGGLLMVVTAQPKVDAVILTSEADRKEGQLVEMTCTATDLATSNFVVWRTEDPELVLRWGGSIISTQSRFVFNTGTTSSSSTVQDFTIRNVQRYDTDEYVCSVYEPLPNGGSNIVASSRITLSVLYFPSSSFPVCSPAGPVILDDGATFNPTCSSEIGNPTVAITVSPLPPHSNTYTWTSTVGSDTIESSLDLNLKVNALLDNVTFECTITSSFRFPETESSCTIGPISVEITATTSGSVDPTEMITSTSDTSVSTVPSNTAVSNSAVIAGAAVGGVAAVLLITFLIVICLRRGLCKCVLLPKDSKLDAGHDQTNAEPATETPRQSYNEHAGLESIQTTSQTTRDGTSTATSPVPRHTVPPRQSESSNSVQTGPIIYALPNKVKANMDTSQDAKPGRHPSSIEQTYDNPVFDQDIATSPSDEDRANAPDKPIALIKPMSAKPPKKPQPYQQKSKTPDNILNHQENLMPLQSPTETPRQDGTILPPSDPMYAEVPSPKREQSSHGNPDGILYADLDLQSETSPDNCKSLSTDGQVVYATVKI